MELIVVDGMSRDGTVEIVREMLEGSDLHWMLLQDGGKGLGYARQAVVNRAKGEYVIWIDGDNVIPPRFVRMHADFVKRNPSLGASGSRIGSKGDSVVARLQGFHWFIRKLRKLEKKAPSWSRIALLPMEGTICRLKALESIGGFDPEIQDSGEDVDLFIRMKLKGWRFGRTPNVETLHYGISSWRYLLQKHIGWGYGRHYLSHKHRQTMRPLVTGRTSFFLSEIIELTLLTASLSKDVACFLMPLHYLVRQVGFFLGFIKAHRAGYGHQFDQV